MTDLEEVTRHLEAAKRAAPADLASHLAPALARFRFIPAEDRRVCADAFEGWTRAHDTPSPLLHAYAVLFQAIDRLQAEDFPASLQLATECRAIFAERDEQDGLGLSGTLIGAAYRTLGNYDLALKVMWEGFELLKASGRYPIFLAAAANSLGNIYFDRGALDEALAMFTVTNQESARAEDFYFGIYGLHGLGRVYMLLGKGAEAEDHFGRALRLAEQHRHPLHTANSLTELANYHYRAGNVAEAERLSARALAIREEHHLLAGAVTNCLRLAEICDQQSRTSDALAFLKRALEIAEEIKVKPKSAQAHLQLSEVYEHAHDLERSLAHYKRYHALREEVQREDSARQVADAKAIYEAERTKKENAVIKAQKAEIERQNLELKDTIDELTRARIGRKAKALTLMLAIGLFVFDDAILGTVLRLLRSDNYFVELGVKMAIIFSLAPINRAIERHLLKGVLRRNRERPAAAAQQVESAA